MELCVTSCPLTQALFVRFTNDSDTIFLWNVVDVLKIALCHVPEDQIVNLYVYRNLKLSKPGVHTWRPCGCTADWILYSGNWNFFLQWWLNFVNWRLNFAQWRLNFTQWRLNFVQWRLEFLQWRLNFVQWCLTFRGISVETFFVSHFWRPEVLRWLLDFFVHPLIYTFPHPARFSPGYQ